MMFKVRIILTGGLYKLQWATSYESFTQVAFAYVRTFFDNYGARSNAGDFQLRKYA